MILHEHVAENGVQVRIARSRELKALVRRSVRSHDRGHENHRCVWLRTAPRLTSPGKPHYQVERRDSLLLEGNLGSLADRADSTSGVIAQPSVGNEIPEGKWSNEMPAAEAQPRSHDLQTG